MIITKIKPQGYCLGVENALKAVDALLANELTKKPIYMLGRIIHNKEVMNKYQEKGIILLDDKAKTRLDLLDEITEGTVIFSAHGVGDIVYQKAVDKGLSILDTTCRHVHTIHELIKMHLELSYDIVYIGTKSHPECEGILALDSRIHLIENFEDVDKLTLNNPFIFATNQTTLSSFDIKDIFNRLRDKYPTIIINDKICGATTVRQKALANQKKVDLCLIVGDKTSSNSKKLVEVSEKYAKIKTILVENVNDIEPEMLRKVKSISVSSGASTPNETTEKVINYLQSLS